jgi:hypothetical protein
MHALERTKRQQIKRGIRLGIGAGTFLIAIMFLRSGLERVVWSATPPHQALPDPKGWIELAVAGVLLLLTADIWLLLLAGYALFGFGKGVLVLIMGRDIYAPHALFSRAEAAWITFFALATLVLLIRFAGARPTIIDRFFLTFYIFALGWHGNIETSSPIDPWQVAGLTGLAIAWCVDLWKKHMRGRFQKDGETLTERGG